MKKASGLYNKDFIPSGLYNVASYVFYRKGVDNEIVD